jgi:hypothetical protein
MSVLPGGRPLYQALPDLDDLLADPHAYLSEAPLALGPRRLYRLAALFALPGLALLLSCLATGKPDGERIALGIAFLLGAAVWAGWSLRLRGHELVLHPDGVEVIHQGTSVWVPWALFHVEGRPFVPESDSPRAGLTLPVNPRAIPYVEQRRDGMVIAHGRQVAGPQWAFTGQDEVLLPARYEITEQDVGELLLLLGGRLGQDLPPSAPATADEPDPRPAELDPTGWFTIPLARLKLPPCCASCGGPRDDTLHVQVMARGDWLFGPLLGGRAIDLPVPVCETCRERIARRQRTGGAVGFAVGALLGAGAGILLGGLLGDGRRFALGLGAFTGFFVGTLAGSILGTALARRPPVRVRRYSPSRGLVSVRFENPEIAAGVIASLRSRQKEQKAAEE